MQEMNYKTYPFYMQRIHPPGKIVVVLSVYLSHSYLCVTSRLLLVLIGIDTAGG